ncbi:hypothetical protein BCR44DRAFT_1033750 [Catenaria anguillulae PL171]|uniref:Uncharacterized protein n=1 Tax=Catenaria anguillulae PL171 TaxID=765915 RepID=A0A1Y2HUN4_9FUNG|nr:hypothetical protein BCR44DRAFT_1033750 [Catenaria anguillulae PL171]
MRRRQSTKHRGHLCAGRRAWRRPLITTKPLAPTADGRHLLTDHRGVKYVFLVLGVGRGLTRAASMYVAVLRDIGTLRRYASAGRHRRSGGDILHLDGGECEGPKTSGQSRRERNGVEGHHTRSISSSGAAVAVHVRPVGVLDGIPVAANEVHMALAGLAAGNLCVGLRHVPFETGNGVVRDLDKERHAKRESTRILELLCRSCVSSALRFSQSLQPS